MEQLFNFYTKYIGDNGEIFDLNTNNVICKDQHISILELPENIYTTLLSKGIDKVSKLIMVGNAFLQFCDFSSEDINILYDSLDEYLSNKQDKVCEIETAVFLTELDLDGSEEYAFLDDEEYDFPDEEEYDSLDEEEYDFLDDVDLNDDFEETCESNQISSQNNSNNSLYNLSIECLDLSCRSFNSLKRYGVNTIGELLSLTEIELYKIRNLGAKSIKEIISKKNDLLNEKITFDQIQTSSVETVNEENIDEICEYFNNITINSLDLSVRSYNCLKKIGITFLSELIKMSPEDIRKINSLGTKSYNEIIGVIKKYKDEYLNSVNGNRNDSILNIDQMISSFFASDMLNVENEYIHLLHYKAYVYDELLSKIVSKSNIFLFLAQEGMEKLSDVLKFDMNNLLEKKGFGRSKYVVLFEDIKKYIKENIITQDNKDNLFLSISNEIPSYIQNFGFDGIKRKDVIEYFSVKYETEVVVLTIEKLIENKVIFIYEDDKLFYKYDSFPYFLYHLKPELTSRTFDIMFSRLDGDTLENIANKYNVTRELVRQQESKFMRKYVCKNDYVLNTFKEDKYAYLFENYSFNKSDFIAVFSEKERTYNYLNMRYHHGKIEFSKAVDDVLIPKRFRACIQKFLDKDFIFVNNDKLPKERTKLLAYYASKNVLVQTRVEEIIKGFNEFIRQYDETMQIFGSDHALEGHVSRIPNMIASLNKKYRFYNFSDYDWEYFLNEINLEGYDGLNIYSTLLFRIHPKLMSKYNILDCYELHNVLRKLYDGKNSNISFGRMPNITVGKFDRKEYMLNILEEYGELTSGEFAKILDEQLGIEIQATFWISELEEYHEFGKYVYHNFNSFDDRLIEVLTKSLTNDFYFKNEIEEIVKQNNLNPTELANASKIYRDLGYLVNSSYIVKKPYNAKTYFKDLLMKDDILDYDTFKKYGYLQIFSETFTELRTSYDIIQFSPQSYINFRKLQAFGISKQDLYDYTELVVSKLEDDYFTLKYLTNMNINSELDDLGFDDIFYESILRYCPKISSFRINNVYVFKNTEESISKTTFISSLIKQYKIIETDNLIYLLKESYGINMDLYDLKESIENTDIYYNSIMDTFYMNYNVFIEEV